MDVTFENCCDYPYLLNVTRFSYAIMKCIIKMAIYNCVHILVIICRDCCCQSQNVKDDRSCLWNTMEQLLEHSLNVAIRRTEDTLLTNWKALWWIGPVHKYVASSLHGCQVYWYWYYIVSKHTMQLLPEEISVALPQAASSLDTTTWKSAKSWVQWWTEPTHLIMSMCMWARITTHIYNLANWIELVLGITRPSPECFPNCRPSHILYY